MSVRKQARDAAERVPKVHVQGFSPQGYSEPPAPTKVADAVSDVWEPLVRDLFDMASTMVRCIDEDDVFELNIETAIKPRLEQIKEALDG